MSMLKTAPPALARYAQEYVRHLREAIRHLPPAEKEVFLLRQNGEWTYEEIAQWHHWSVDGVKQQMRSALRKLRAVFQAVPSA
jgi:RNA polymerase sigma-70 factor (ECF subfamily)